MSSERRSSESFFNCTPAERAVFEAGIKLGGIFHQFTGTPVSMQSAGSLEKGMMEAVRSQPFVKVVHIEINRQMLRERCGGEEKTGLGNAAVGNAAMGNAAVGENNATPEMGRGAITKQTGDLGDSYTTLTGEMLLVRLTIAFKGKMAVCGMEYVEELDYPLMYVDRIEDICDEDYCPP